MNQNLLPENQCWPNVFQDFSDKLLIEHRQPETTSFYVFEDCQNLQDCSLLGLLSAENSDSPLFVNNSEIKSNIFTQKLSTKNTSTKANAKRKNPSFEIISSEASTISSDNLTENAAQKLPFANDALQSPKGWKKRKQYKQHVYSKNYRQKKKQQFKILQQQNQFLKKKIDELQFRLRQTEKQLNKIKHNFEQQNKSVKQLNHLWLSKIQQLLQSNLQNEEQLYQQFNDSYEIYGFGGKQKIDKLQYHMNQFFDHILKDSEKYMALTVINNTGLLGDSPDHGYSEANYTIFQIMEYDQYKLETVKKFLGPFLKPSMQRIQKSCQQLYQDFQNVMNEVRQTHQYLKKSRNKDFLSIKQRLQMQNWFQSNRYSKQLRKLRQDWQQSLKNAKQEAVQIKRKKVRV